MKTTKTVVIVETDGNRHGGQWDVRIVALSQSCGTICFKFWIDS